MNTITFIGAGNMASSIIGGLKANGYPADKISACDPNADTRKRVEQDHGIATSDSAENSPQTQAADVVVLAVKPQILKTVSTELGKHIRSDALVISVAAGIPSAAIENWLGGERAIVRCMPNTPALIQQGASGLYANNRVTKEQKALTDTLMAAIGQSIWVDEENLIDAVTAVSGSGPAYFFLFMEAMIAAGVKQGLSVEQAEQLTLQTALGAAKLAQSSDVNVAELRRRVTSPAGTTEQALLSFEADQLRTSVDNAMVACAERSKAMAEELV